MRYEKNNDVFYAYDEQQGSEPLASASYKLIKDGVSRVVITDIYQNEHSDYAADALLAHIEQESARQGVKYAQLGVSDSSDSDMLGKLALHRGYRENFSEWCILGYPYDMIKDSKKLMSYRTDRAGTGICRYLTHSQVMMYCDDGNIPEHVSSIAAETADLKHSLFCIDGDRMVSSVLLDEMTADYVCIADMYLKMRYKTPIVLVKLLAAVLLDDNLIKRPPKYVFINCTDHRFVRMCNSLFGTEEFRKNVVTYMKKL